MKLVIIQVLVAVKWLLPFFIFSAAYSPMISNAESVHLNTKMQVSSVRADININDSRNAIALQWTEGHTAHKQKMILPAEWTAWVGDNKVSYLPTIFPWRLIGENIVIVVGTTPSAAYGIRAPLIYRLQHHEWKLVAKPEMLQFTNRGGFYIYGERIYLWDYEMNPSQAHSAAQRYWIRVLSLSGGRLVQIKKALSRKKYLAESDFESSTPPEYLSPTSDPLREFGLRWRWWGSSR